MTKDTEKHDSGEVQHTSGGWDTGQKRTFAWTLGVGLVIVIIWATGSAADKSSNGDEIKPKQPAPVVEPYTPPAATPQPALKVPTYQGGHGSDACTDDCSGHDAGYQWAEDNDICDTSYSNGNSESFNEGVRSWAEDNCSSDSEDSSDESI